MAQVTVVGEVVVDRFITRNDVHDVAGGSAANTAIALQRAGHDCALRARYSRDSAGQFLKTHAQAAELDLSCSVDAEQPATVVTVELAEDGQPRYTFVLDGTADWQWTRDDLMCPLPAGTQAIVLGSLAAIREPSYTTLYKWIEEMTDPFIAYDPNARPSAVPQSESEEVRQRMHNWARMAQVVKVSDEDLDWIAPGEDPRSVVAQWCTQGPAVVVLTQGAKGATMYTAADTVIHVDPPSVTVVDTVGAGDTLMAWLVAGLCDAGMTRKHTPASDQLADVLRKAVNAAAITCTRKGCQPPTAAEAARL